jgi:anti-sigma factor RsiW
VSSPEQHTCFDGRDPAQLLAYLDGELDASALKELEEHLTACPVCAAELARLRQMDSLLKKHPDTFHPDEEALFRFALRREDPGGRIAQHLALCRNCADDLDILLEMIAAGSQIPKQPARLPDALISDLQKLYPTSGRETAWQVLPSWFADFLKAPFRLPVLAVGTAAAVAIIAAVGIPMWRALKNDVPSAEIFKMVEPSSLQKQASVPATVDQVPAAPPTEEPVRDREKAKREGGQRETASVEPQPSSVAPPPSPSKAEAELNPAVRSGKDRPDRRISAQVEAKRAAKPGELSTPSRGEGTIAPGRFDYHALKQAPPGTSDTKHEAWPGHLPDESDSRTPVSVHIVDTQGKTLRNLTWTVPRELEPGYRFIVQVPPAGRDASASNRIAEAKEDVSGLPRQSVGGLVINVRVEQKGEYYTIEAELIDSNSNRSLNTVKAYNVPVEGAPVKIGAMVSSLLRSP